ncbi:VP3 [Sulfolobus spindle-shaped virus]|nr:VP3 [Sulfolobus spindle-shaped virus]
MEVNLKQILFLFLFIVIGVVLLSPIMSYVTTLTTPYFTTVSGTVTSTISNSQYVGPTNATLISLVPIFYILILLVAPAVLAYKMWRDE